MAFGVLKDGGRIGELALQVKVLACQPEFSSWKPHGWGEQWFLQGVFSPPRAFTVCKCLHAHKRHASVCIWRPKESNKAEALCQPFQKIREHARFSTQMQLVYFDLSSSKLLTPQLKYAVCSNKYQAVVMTDQPICASRMYNFCL